jgi:tellurite resistance protein TerC
VSDISGDVPLVAWAATISALVALLALDLLLVSRRKDTIRPATAGRWIAIYIGLAAVACAVMLLSLGAATAEQFAATYLTEYSLSADNLFVFMLIVDSYAVPAIATEHVLTIGILLSLVLRTLFITAGAAAVHAFTWIFYLFGGFLIYTATRLLFSRADTERGEAEKPPGIEFMARIIPATDVYDGRRFTTMTATRRVLTPIPLVITAIGVTNLIFALDSLPAAFGLTRSSYIIITANTFAMLGLRQLYYLVGGLLQRLTYLPVALALVLGFIGAKLVLEALHDSGAGQAPTVGSGVSLAVIFGILGVAVVASLAHHHRTPTHNPATEGETNDHR